MPVSVIVGGQYGSEGKGKVSAFLAATRDASALVRVGGPNSGHSALDSDGHLWTFRQLPAAITQSKAVVLLPAGSLIDVDLLLSEVRQYNLPLDRLRIDARASIVTGRHRNIERDIVGRIGSTASGTGAALVERIARSDTHLRATDVDELKPFIERDVAMLMRSLLAKDKRIIIEGTQGFGLSIWHADDYPFATSRDTTASAFLSEAGLAPHDVDEVALVIRAFPIRVGGNSGPLDHEITWEILSHEAMLPNGFQELTTATKRVRRVGRFSSDVVRRAIASNAPHLIVLNHMDYIDPMSKTEGPTEKSRRFIEHVEQTIGSVISYVGYGPDLMLTRRQAIDMGA